jgi:hypothetical protein
MNTLPPVAPALTPATLTAAKERTYFAFVVVAAMAIPAFQKVRQASITMTR